MVSKKLLSVLSCAVVILTGGGLASARSETRVLRVVADPNNFPYSNAQLDGFENKIVALVAQELNATVEYTWVSQHGGGFSTSLRESGCDLATGTAPAGTADLTTKPYCRSGYVILTRSDRTLDIQSLDDVTLQILQVGVSVADSDQVVLASLSSRGLAERVHLYPVSGSSPYSTPLLDALAKGEIDVGIVPAPIGGFLMKRYGGIFSVTALHQEGPFLGASLCLAVRAGDSALREELNLALVRRHDEIAAILNTFGVASAD